MIAVSHYDDMGSSVNAHPVSMRSSGIVHPESEFRSGRDKLDDSSNYRPHTWTCVQSRGIGPLIIIIGTFDNIYLTLGVGR